MKNIKLLLACGLVSVLVAVTYYLFETAVHESINYIWDDLFNSEENRLVVVPLAVVLGMIYFGAQRLLDKKSEGKESHGLGGEKFDPSLKALFVILLLGYFSLIAGASLGPEAILVPASMTVAAIVGVKFYKKDTTASKALMAASIIALFTAFFHSFFVGMLALLLVKKQTGAALTQGLIVVAVISAGVSFVVLNAIDPQSSYFDFPELSYEIIIRDLVAGLILVLAGYAATFLLRFSHIFVESFRKEIQTRGWLLASLIAVFGLAGLYLLGGPLVEFTGNQAISSLLEESSSLGLLGLVWVLLIKIAAISWSKAMGYRGGLIFPMVFVASTLVAMSQQLVGSTNFGVCLIFAMAGILLAEKKAKILF